MLACFLANPALAQSTWGLTQLMASLAQVKSASAQFTEVKTMAVLDAPLVASGTLDYTAPDWMQKVTVSPVPERFVLDAGEITMSGGQDGQTHMFSVRQDPMIGGLTGGILDTLAGNLPALERVYDVRFSGTPTDWQLVLRPRDPTMTRFISYIRISGAQNRIGGIDTLSGNGDHSEMRIDETVSDAQ